MRAYSRAQEYIKNLGLLHARITPHSGQITAGRSIFTDSKKFVFLQCGRNWGKTEFIVYCAVRSAISLANSQNYIVLPERKQAVEVIWAGARLKKIIPPELLHSDPKKAWNKAELRVTFKNGSFIKLEGSDNPDSLRGIKPHFVAYDEFRDFKSDTYDIMEPNLGANDATLLIGSTPPDREGHYTAIRKLFVEEVNTGNQEYFYLEMPTETNPHYPRNRLDSTKAMLIKRGEYSKWLREYMAQFIPGGANAVFPMFADRKKGIVKPAAVIKEILEPDKSKLEWYAVFDPASNTVFAVLFAAINKYTGQIYLVDEIYERDRMRTGAGMIWARAQEIKQKYYPRLDKWSNIYDEQAAWFINDLERHHLVGPNEATEPTHKRSRDKDEDMSMIKDLFLAENRILISERCVNTIWEIENYTTAEDGGYLKKDDHQVDNIRYLIAGSQYEPSETPDPDALPEKYEHLKKYLDVDSWYAEKRREQDWDYDAPEGDVFHIEDLNPGGVIC